MPHNIYLDECTPILLKDRLLFHNPSGFNVEHAGQLSQRGLSDAEHLRRAAGKRAILVTLNIKDFVLLHRWWKTLHTWVVLSDPHTGILAASVFVPVDVLGAEIFHFLTQQPAPILENNMYIHRQGKWNPERW